MVMMRAIKAKRVTVAVDYADTIFADRLRLVGWAEQFDVVKSQSCTKWSERVESWWQR